MSLEDNITLRSFLNDNEINKAELKLTTFGKLMKEVSKKIEGESRNIIRINIDSILINKQTGKIILPENLFKNESLDKTMAGFDTGISLIADRKSTKENKRVSFALMILGWYANDTKDAVVSDMEVLENFRDYMSKVPSYLQPYFVNIFKKMDYETSFDEYYTKNFEEKIKKEVENAMHDYALNEEQLERITNLCINKGIRNKGEVSKGYEEEYILLNKKEIVQNVTDNFKDIKQNDTYENQNRVERVRYDETIPRTRNTPDILDQNNGAYAVILFVMEIISLIFLVALVTFVIYKGLS